MTKSGIENAKLIRRWKIVPRYFIHPPILGSVLAALNNENVLASPMGRTVSTALNRLHGARWGGRVVSGRGEGEGGEGWAQGRL